MGYQELTLQIGEAWSLVDVADDVHGFNAISTRLC
jgi:hypothetical protein